MGIDQNIVEKTFGKFLAMVFVEKEGETCGETLPENCSKN
jgi:hypothetical protein